MEGPLWHTVHGNLVEEIARQLAPKLRPKYLALTNQRVIVATSDALELGGYQVLMPYVASTTSVSIRATEAQIGAPLVLDALLPETISQPYVEICDMARRQLVAAIEGLSLTNKRGDGLEEFRRKRQEMLAASTHYLEIDLLRSGERFPLGGTLPSVPYFVFLSRANQRPRVHLWPIALDERLPQVNVPLLAGDPDVVLDLQQALNTIYELFGYDQAVRHGQPPAVPLSGEQMSWVRKQLSPQS